MIKEIENREDLKLLVSTFYEKIRADQEIGFFFNETITNWEEHLEKLTDFWEMNIFGTRKFTGNPIVAHNAVDKKFNQQITSNIFGIWLNIWFATIDELFVGENADVLKRRAQKMSTFLFMNIFESRRKV
ncbi:group III truncated hemoglobin [Flavobacterium sp. I-SCBP12n]|uniref:Group III truncated hemoglobin n=1 Tax=Flavobacterium pygoscelis TaxID=2893176 RepID=A0A9X1XRX9_9FLAO|nr:MULTISPECIES: group III truncated hemoglobin [Flavobacterium]MCK8142234.1 group III truncated hemoglobin [Flavobacterium pygoscelis]